MTTTELSQEELVDLVSKHLGPESWFEIAPKLTRWLARGDGIAVYQNDDLSSSLVGHIVLFSWGSPDAQIAVTSVEDLPIVCPVELSGYGLRSWQYYLQGVYTGALEFEA